MKAIAGQTWVSKGRVNKHGQRHAVTIINPLIFAGRAPLMMDPVVVESTSSGRRYTMQYRTLFYRFELEA